MKRRQACRLPTCGAARSQQSLSNGMAAGRLLPYTIPTASPRRFRGGKKQDKAKVTILRNFEPGIGSGARVHPRTYLTEPIHLVNTLVRDAVPTGTNAVRTQLTRLPRLSSA
jgi:hypothetical protein